MRYRNRTRLFRPRLAFAVLLAVALGAVDAAAQEVRLLVQRSPLAGFRYYEAPALFDRLQQGEILTLVREPENRHDPNAVRVDWRGHKLGYVPRSQNAALAWALDGGQRLEARIAQRRPHPNPRRRVELEVFVR